MGIKRAVCGERYYLQVPLLLQKCLTADCLNKTTRENLWIFVEYQENTVNIGGIYLLVSISVYLRREEVQIQKRDLVIYRWLAKIGLEDSGKDWLIRRILG